MNGLLGGLPSFSVRRPVFIIVINLLIILAGASAILGVDVRELPNVERPLVSVRANYRGASPETIDTEVTSVLEGAVATVPGVHSIEASSEENNSRLRVEFNSNYNLDVAANDVREAVSRVQTELPDEVENLFVVKADDEAQAIIEIAASSQILSKEELAKRIEKDVGPNFLTVPGVAEVRLNGNQKRVLRVLLDPARLAGLKVSVPEVIQTLRQARLDVPAGSYESQDTEFIIRAYASVLEPERVEALFVRDEIRIKDIGVAFYGPDDPESYSLLNGREVVGLEVVRQAGSNTIAIADEVRERVARINERTDEFELYIISDSSIFIEGALLEVIYSLIFAVVIVLLIIAIFLGDISAVMIPAVTMPVSLIGTLAAIWAMGFSINLLTLLALVLATGLIVDDAIVVLENIQRHRREGVKPMAAAVLGTDQVFFAVIATTATLISVFLPIAFLPGQIGQLFREFGLVLAVSVSISSFVALTLCPMMASRFRSLGEISKSGVSGNIQKAGEKLGTHCKTYYLSSLDYVCYRKPFLATTLTVVLAGFGLWCLIGFDQELLPQEDRGVIRVLVTGPDGSTLSYADRQSVQVEQILKPYRDAGVLKDLFTIVGSFDPNRALTTATLVPWKERSISQMKILKDINKSLKGIPGAEVRIRSENSLNIRGGGSGGLELALLGDDYQKILETANRLSRRLLKEVPSVEGAIVQFDTSQSQLSFNINRDRANDLRVPLAAISDTLQVMVDRYDVIDLSVDDEAVPILLGSLKGTINDPGDLLNVFIPNDNKDLVPLSSIVSVQETGVAAELDRHAQRRAIEIDVGIAPGTSLGDAVNQIREIADSELPTGMSVLFLGDAATLSETTQEVAITFVIALLVVFLVLAAQFENIASAIIVVFTVPFGLAAAVLALLLSGQTLNLYSQIGLVMLVGLMTKNSILLVEFMDQLRDEGMDVKDAIMEGVSVRLRPLAMTVISTVVGSLPLILSSGPGAEARSAIGWVIFGGLGFSSLFTLYLTPLGYRLIAPYVARRSNAAELLDLELSEASLITVSERKNVKLEPSGNTGEL